jgi:putative ABC transport system permease protein
MKFIPLVISNLLRNRRRTILSVLSIGVSTFIFAALMSVPAVAAKLLRDRISALRIVCSAKAGFSYPLPAAYGERIRGLPHVDAMTGYIVMMTTYRELNQYVPVIGLDPAQLHLMWPDWSSGEAAAALGHSRSAGLVGQALMQRYKWRVGDNVILHGIFPAADLGFTVVGRLSDKATDNVVIVPIERLNQFGELRGKVGAFFVKADRSEFARPLVKEIDRSFANAPLETMTQTEMAVAQGQLHDFRLLFVGVKLIAAIIVMVIALVSANTAAMAVRERRHELAVMRAMGFTRGYLVSFIISEGLLMGLVAGVLGSSIAYGVLRVAGSRALGEEFGLHLMPVVASESIGLAAVIGLLSAAIPALSATRSTIVDSLRVIA